MIRDAWNTLGAKIKEDAAEIFGQADYLPVRRDMVNDALGYRAASVTDAWTGRSRWGDGVKGAVRETATAFFGKDGYRYLATVEGGIQDVVSYAKTTIIVRSLVVALDNIMGNGLHLMLHGIDPVTGFKAMRDR